MATCSHIVKESSGPCEDTVRSNWRVLQAGAELGQAADLARDGACGGHMWPRERFHCGTALLCCSRIVPRAAIAEALAAEFCQRPGFDVCLTAPSGG